MIVFKDASVHKKITEPEPPLPPPPPFYFYMQVCWKYSCKVTNYIIDVDCVSVTIARST